MATKLIVSELPLSVTEANLIELFSKYGSVSEVSIGTQSNNKNATVYMPDSGMAQKAMTQLNNKLFMDQKIRVNQSLLARS